MVKYMMETKLCKRCNCDISFRHGNATFCEWCAIQAKKEYNEKYMKQFPKPARGEYYKYYKFLLTLSKDELSALYTIKQQMCKNNKKEIKRQLLLIQEAYKRKESE